MIGAVYNSEKGGNHKLGTLVAKVFAQTHLGSVTIIGAR